MNQQQTVLANNNFNPLSTFQQNKQAWENAIAAYVGEDPLELWYNYICWYEQNAGLDTENAFEAILGKCLSMYEYKDNFKQDTRMVRLWMKYIDLKPNALNLYQLLYQRDVGTQCTIFYIGWASYFESAGALKQAESVFNLGFQVNAQPHDELQAAHNKFRAVLAQSLLYEEPSAAAAVAPSAQPATNAAATEAAAAAATAPTHSKKRQASQMSGGAAEDQLQQQLEHQQQQQQQLHEQQQHAQPESQPAYAEHQQQQHHHQPAGADGEQHTAQQQPPPHPNAKRHRTNHQHHSHHQQQQQPPHHQEQQQQHQQQQQQHHHHQHHQQHNHPQYNHHNHHQQPQSGPAESPHTSTEGYNTAGTEHQPQPAAAAATADLISSSLYSVYDEAIPPHQQQQQLAPNAADTDDDGSAAAAAAAAAELSGQPPAIFLPTDFCRRVSHPADDAWTVPLCLDEPFEPNKACNYPKQLVYPETEGCEYSPEEIRARRWLQQLERRRRDEQLRLQEEQRQLQLELAAEQERLRAAAELERLRVAEQERVRQAEYQRRAADVERKRLEQEEVAAAAANGGGETTSSMYQQYYTLNGYQQQQHQHHQQHASSSNTSHHHHSSSSSNLHHSSSQQQQQQQQHQHQQHHHHHHHNNTTTTTTTTSVIRTVGNGGSVEEQFEASTIRFSTGNGQSRPKTITIKFRKEMPPQEATTSAAAAGAAQQLEAGGQWSASLGGGGHTTPKAAKKERKSKTAKRLLNGNQQQPHNNNSGHNQAALAAQQLLEQQQQQQQQQILLQQQQQQQQLQLQQQLQQSHPVAPSSSDDSNFSYAGSTTAPSHNNHSHNHNNTADAQPLGRRGGFGDDEDDDDDSNSNSNAASFPASAYNGAAGNNVNHPATPSATTSSSHPHHQPPNSRRAFPAFATSTPMRSSPAAAAASSAAAASGASTPAAATAASSAYHQLSAARSRATAATAAPPPPQHMTPHAFKILKRRESASTSALLGQNDDSMCSATSMSSLPQSNSFFDAENDAGMQQRRLERATATIQSHLSRPHLDPFNSELCKALLTQMGFPSRQHEDTYKLVAQPINKLANARTAMLAGVPFNIDREVGRGSYGSVYRATNAQTGATVALKYQKPANNWELYICTEVHRRCTDPALLSGFMDISVGIVAPNASIIVSEFSPFGSLLDVNNRWRQGTTKVMPESLVMHFSVQILAVIEHLHRCRIIHADIKPDNFLLMRIPDPHAQVPSIRLIDFGCAIDMKCFDEGTQFKKRIETDGFTCIEMQEGRPWSYQTDIFCIAGTIHVMLFGEYMQPVKKFGQWEIKNKLPRYLKKHIWSEVFASCLNIADADHLPDLLAFRSKIEDELYAMESELQKHIRTLSNILHKR